MKPKNAVNPLLYSRKQTAERLGLCEASVDVLIARGLLTVRKMGRKRSIPASSIESFAQKGVERIWPRKINGKSTRHLETSKTER